MRDSPLGGRARSGQNVARSRQREHRVLVRERPEFSDGSANRDEGRDATSVGEPTGVADATLTLRRRRARAHGVYLLYSRSPRRR
jgi:hypothetical protein